MGVGPSLNQKAMHYGVQYFDDDYWKISESILKRTSSTAKLHVIDELCKPIATYSSHKHAYLIDQYLLDSTEIVNVDEYFREIEWRNQCEYLVNVKYIKGFSTPTICQTSAPKNYLYIQHIPLRLSQITDIPFPENLSLLKACLKGFQYIYLHTRTLDIKEDQICLNQQGKVKVWMNADLAKSTPSINNIFRTSRKSQIALVKEVINIIDENTDHQFEPKNFKQYLREQKLQNLTFAESIQAVQQFANALLIAIPMSLVSVNDLFDPLLNVNRRISNNEYNQVNNSYSIGRCAQTNETKMLESIPIQNEECSAHHYTNHSQPQFIKYLDTYHCQKEDVAVRSTLPLKIIQYPIKANYATKSAANNFKNFINFHQHPSSTIPTNTENEQKYQNLVKDDDEWKYYDVNGWLEIDPEILRDLKSINTSS